MCRLIPVPTATQAQGTSHLAEAKKGKPCPTPVFAVEFFAMTSRSASPEPASVSPRRHHDLPGRQSQAFRRRFRGFLANLP